MRALVIAVAVTVIIGLNSSWARESVKKDDTRNTRQSAFELSPLNPYYSQAFNKSLFNSGLGYGSQLSPYTTHFERPHTFRYSPQESITVIPNSEPNLNQYQAQQAHYNAQANLRARPQTRLRTQPQSQQSLQQQQQQQQLQYQQAQYQRQLQQAAQQAQQLQALQQPIQPIYYNQPPPISFQHIYSTPAPALYSTPLYNVPAQQYGNLIDQGFFKYPVYVDPNLATTFGEPPKPMFMKKRTLQDLCAQYVPEEKTVIYVLSQNPREPPEEIEVPQVPTPTKPSKPEVYFVKYNTPEEAELAQKHIQAQYDALGGNSEISNEGLSPVTTAQEVLNGAHNITRSIPLGNNLRHRH